MAESFIERRKRELGLNSKPTNEMSFVEKRKIELGLAKDTRPKPKNETAPDFNILNTPVMKQVNAEKPKTVKPSATTSPKNSSNQTTAKKSKGGIPALDYLNDKLGGVVEGLSNFGNRAAISATDAMGLGQVRNRLDDGPAFIANTFKENAAPADTTMEKIADIGGELLGFAAPTALAYGTGGKMALKGLEKFAPNANVVLKNLVRGAGAGLAYGTAKEGLDAAVGEEDKELIDRLKSIGIDTVLFSGGDAALSAVGRGIKAMSQHAKNTATGLGENAIKTVSDNSRFVKSPFSDGSAVSNQIAQNYTRAVGRTFEGGSRASKVQPPPTLPTPAAATESLVTQPVLQSGKKLIEQASAAPKGPANGPISKSEIDDLLRGIQEEYSPNGPKSTQVKETPQPVTFKTSKGSTYSLSADGKTQRTKTLHQGHDPNDTGLKSLSDDTVYVDKNESSRIGSHFGMDKESRPKILYREDGIYLVSWNKQANRWGINGKPIPYTKNPEVGKSPIEMWGIDTDPQLGKKVSKIHAGNEIIEVSGSAPKPQPPQGIRANYKNQLDNGKFSDELQTKIRNTDQTYDIVRNAESVAKANENVKNLTVAESNFMGNKEFSAEHVTTGYRLMQELDSLAQKEVDEALKGSLLERSLNVAEKLAEDLTKAGQTVQAASVLSRLSPEGQLLALTRRAKAHGKTVTVEDKVKFQDLAAKVQEKSGAGKRANEFNEILNRMEKGENVGVDDIKKLSDYLSGSEKVIKQPKVKEVTVKDELPKEFNDVKKRDKVVSFFDDVEQAALARIAARKNNLNSLPVGEWADHAIVAAAQIAKGTIKAATHAEDLVKLFGEEIRPYASEVFQKAQTMVNKVSRSAGEGNLERANEAFRRASGQAAAEKAIVKETADHVRKLIADAKSGKLDAADVQKLRDYSDEIAEMISDKPKRIISQEEKFLQSVKSLAKKIAQVESGSIPANQANREVSSLLRQVTKLADEGMPPGAKQPIDNKALSDIAHDVMEKTRPTPKPKTLQEKIVEKYLRENEKVSQKDIDTLRQLAKDVTRLSGDQKLDADIAMQKILNSYEKSSVWDKVLALRYMGMLLNSSTQLINAVSGPIMANTGVLADVFGTMLDVAMSTVLKTPRTTTLYGTSPLKFIARYYKNLKTGAKAGFQGVNPAGIQGTNEIRGLAFKSVKNPLTFVPAMGERVLGAVAKGPDFATYRSVYESEMIKQGFLDAKNNGIKGKQNIQKHIEEFINEPPEKAILQADRIGKNTTFQRSDTSGGIAANWLNNSPKGVKPIVNTIFPFVRTPVNIASTAVTLTPAGLIKGLYQLTSKSDASRREAIRTLSLGLTGSAGLGTAGYYLQQIGVITGANDSGDKDVDAIRDQAGKGKYRFNTSALKRYLGSMLNGEGSEAAEKAAQYQKGDKQFDYNKFQPLAFPAAIGASLSENKDKSISKRVAKAGEDAYGSLFGMSTLKGVQDVFQPQYGGTLGEKALGTPVRIAESFFKSFSSGGLAQEARRQDPIQRKVPYNDGILPDTIGYFKSRTPGLSQSLPPNKTTLGQNKMNAPGIKGAYLNPYRSEVAPYNEAAAIISDLIDRTGDKALAPSAPEKDISGRDKNGLDVTIKIPPKIYEKMQEDLGQQIIKRVMSIPADWSDDKKAARIKTIYSIERAAQKNKVAKEMGLRIK